MFASSPDNSRLKRWQPVLSIFSVNYINGREIIRRKDGHSFTSVRIKLTPSYIHLPKSYVPFSPFSNGGMLLHSARFFACPNICSGNENLWAMAVKAPVQDTILLDGKVYLAKTCWWDKNEGQKLYVGQQRSDHNANYISIIDPYLTHTIGKQLHTILPSMMMFLEKSYGALSRKPMLFASFGVTHDGRFGRQGGTLPNQIFMHWYGDVAYQENNLAATLWFFAHEAAHLYQNLGGKAITPVDNWLHEGHAEMMAMKIMLNLLPQYQAFVDDKVANATTSCLAISDDSSLSPQIAVNNYQALYDCGLYIFNTIENSHGRSDVTETLWLAFINETQNDKQIDSLELITLAEKKYGLSKKNTKNFRKLIGIHLHIPIN
jgi:hypothetical protein